MERHMVEKFGDSMMVQVRVKRQQSRGMDRLILLLPVISVHVHK